MKPTCPPCRPHLEASSADRMERGRSKTVSGLCPGAAPAGPTLPPAPAGSTLVSARAGPASLPAPGGSGGSLARLSF